MVRRPFCGMAVCFLLGILGAAYRTADGMRLLFLAAAAWLVLLCFANRFGCRRGLVRLYLVLCMLAVCVGFGRYEGELSKRAGALLASGAGREVLVQGRVAGKQLKNNQYIYELTSCFIGRYTSDLSVQEPAACGRVLVYSVSDVASIGETLVLRGTKKVWTHARNEGGFDAASFYAARGFDFGVEDVEILAVHGKAHRWKEALFALRLRTKELYATVLKPEAGGVLAAMVLGDKALLDEETKRLYQTAGLSHMMAISGLHISVLGLSLYRFLRKRGLGFGLSGILAWVVLYMYGTMAGMGTSISRALGMFALLLTAEALGRGYDSLNALGVLALVLLWKNPFLLWDAGFQFSFVAIWGITWLGNCVSFAQKPHCKIKEKIFSGGAVLLATLPLVAWHYYEVPLYALVMNLLVLPFVGVLLASGVAGGIVGLWSMRAAAGVLFFSEKLLVLVRSLCGLCAELPCSMVIVGRPPLFRVVCYYGGLVLLALLAYRRRAEARGGQDDETGKRLLAASFLLTVLLLFPAPRSFALDVLDVGQGDGICLRTEEGYTVFLDGGSSDVKEVGVYRILPFLKYNGVRSIDFWLVSHTDEDHISGLRELLWAGYPVKNLVFAERVPRDAVYEALCQLAAKNNVRILHVGAGDCLHLGTAKLHILYPEKGSEAAAERGDTVALDKNAASLVALYEEGAFSALFTGDIASAQEREIAVRLRKAYAGGVIADLSLDCYKAAHHGSGHSNSREWLLGLQPEISVISCSKKNRYGHPSKEAVAHIKEAGSRVFYTMESGQICVRKCGKETVAGGFFRAGNTDVPSGTAESGR